MAKRIVEIDGVKLNIIDLKGKDYLPVQDRILWFREKEKGGNIVTEMLHFTEDFAVFRATVMVGSGKTVSTGYKREDKKHFADYIEKAETGSVGRALANAGYGTQFAQDLEEGIKNDAPRVVDAPRERERERETEREPRRENGLSESEKQAVIEELNKCKNMTALKKLWIDISKLQGTLSRENYAEFSLYKDQRKKELNNGKFSTVSSI